MESIKKLLSSLNELKNKLLPTVPSLREVHHNVIMVYVELQAQPQGEELTFLKSIKAPKFATKEDTEYGFCISLPVPHETFDVSVPYTVNEYLKKCFQFWKQCGISENSCSKACGNFEENGLIDYTYSFGNVYVNLYRSNTNPY